MGNFSGGKTTSLASEMTGVAIFAAILSLLAQISVPIGIGVPFTLQTFGVYLICLLSGQRTAFWSVLIYILLGAIGLPVFANFSGGLGVIFGVTGGYIFGFLVASLVIPFLVAKIPASVSGWKKFLFQYVAVLIGVFAVHLCGMAQFAWVGSMEFFKAVKILLMFVPVDFIKAALAVFVGSILQRRLQQAGIGLRK